MIKSNQQNQWHAHLNAVKLKRKPVDLLLQLITIKTNRLFCLCILQ